MSDVSGINGNESVPKEAWWSLANERSRNIAIQAFVLLFVILVVGFIAHNTATNLEKRGIASGFDFLDQPTGLTEVAFSVIPYSEKNTHGYFFLVGVTNTLVVSVLGIFFATILGVIVGLGRLSSNWLVAKISSAYVEMMRNIPLLLQILFWYGGVWLMLPHPRKSISLFDVAFLNNRGIELPKPVFEAGAGWMLIALVVAVIGAFVFSRWAKKRQRETGQSLPRFWGSVGIVVGLPFVVAAIMGFPWVWDVPELGRFNFKGGISIFSGFMPLLFALSTYTAAFIAEIVRAGILAVPKGQKEAAAALGLHPGQSTRLVVLPQALRVILPPLTSQYLNLVKNSSLASAAAFPDVVSLFTGPTLEQFGQAVEVILMIMLFYLTISLTISLFMNLYNRSIALKGAR